MLVLHSISVVMVLAILGPPPGVRPFLPLSPTRSKSASHLTPLRSPPLLFVMPGLVAVGAVVVFILGLTECAPSGTPCFVFCDWLVVDTGFQRLVAIWLSSGICECFGTHVGIKERSFGILGLPSYHGPCFGIFE